MGDDEVPLREAIDLVLQRLARLPSSVESDVIKRRAQDCLSELARFDQEVPTVEAKARLERHVLAMHVMVAKLERA
jgi:hypothetical protein